MVMIAWLKLEIAVLTVNQSEPEGHWRLSWSQVSDWRGCRDSVASVAMEWIDAGNKVDSDSQTVNVNNDNVADQWTDDTGEAHLA